jgi:hypothetical protein
VDKPWKPNGVFFKVLLVSHLFATGRNVNGLFFMFIRQARNSLLKNIHNGTSRISNRKQCITRSRRRDARNFINLHSQCFFQVFLPPSPPRELHRGLYLSTRGSVGGTIPAHFRDPVLLQYSQTCSKQSKNKEHRKHTQPQQQGRQNLPPLIEKDVGSTTDTALWVGATHH